MDAKNYVIFFDFDNTVTAFDVLDDILFRFSIDDKWLGLEEKWKNGEIGSRECLRGQIKGVRIGRDKLDRYLAKVRLDPYFKKLVTFLKSKRIKTIIVSDNFDYVLNNIFKFNGIHELKTYSNRLKLAQERLIPSFPLASRRCGACAHCKNATIRNNTNKDSTVVYIGDGRSDVCASKLADLVFAKGYLRDYLKAKKIDHIPCNGLKEAYEYFKGKL